MANTTMRMITTTTPPPATPRMSGVLFFFRVSGPAPRRSRREARPPAIGGAAGELRRGSKAGICPVMPARRGSTAGICPLGAGPPGVAQGAGAGPERWGAVGRAGRRARAAARGTCSMFRHCPQMNVDPGGSDDTSNRAWHFGQATRFMSGSEFLQTGGGATPDVPF